MLDYDKIIDTLWRHICIPQNDNAGNVWEYPQGVQEAAADAIRAIDKLSAMLDRACRTLAGYGSEEPCGTLFYISEERRVCDQTCHSDGAGEECWRRYLRLVAGEEEE